MLRRATITVNDPTGRYKNTLTERFVAQWHLRCAPKIYAGFYDMLVEYRIKVALRDVDFANTHDMEWVQDAIYKAMDERDKADR